MHVNFVVTCDTAQREKFYVINSFSPSLLVEISLDRTFVEKRVKMAEAATSHILLPRWLEPGYDNYFSDLTVSKHHVGALHELVYCIEMSWSKAE